MSEDKDIVAVAGLRPEGITESEAEVLTTRLVKELVRTDCFRVVDRTEKKAILEEMAFQQTGICDVANDLTGGQLLGVQWFVCGAVGWVGTTYTICIYLIDVATGQIGKAVSKDFVGAKLDELLMVGVESVAVMLAKANQKS